MMLATFKLVIKMATDSNEYAERYGFKSNVKYIKEIKGLSEEVINEISSTKNEPDWMLEKRLTAYKVYKEKPLPAWGIDLSEIKFDDIYYYIKPTDRKATEWNDVPEEIKNAFDRLGVPEAEKKFFAGTEAQFDSEAVYGSIKKELESQGIIFTDMDTAVKKYPELVKEYFGTVIPPTDNKFAALNTAVWSGGSFVYVPENVKVRMPLQAYFRINLENAGQFERTLIIAEEGADVTYIEGCTAPIYLSSSLHAANVEIIVKKNAHVKYVTVQNWSKNVYNLVTQRAHAYENAHMEWVDANIGSKANMKYPSIYLMGNGAKGDILSIGMAGQGQVQDVGGKVLHLAPNTASRIVSKNISTGNGISTYRGLVYIGKKAENAKSAVKCDSLLVNNNSKANTYPYSQVLREDATFSHEATVGKIGREELFYLMARGFTEEEALTMITLGFIEPLAKELPLEYLIELKRLIKLDMPNAVG